MLYFPLTADVIAEPTLADLPQTLLVIALVVAALLLTAAAIAILAPSQKVIPHFHPLSFFRERIFFCKIKMTGVDITFSRHYNM